MVFKTWGEAVAALDKLTAAATERQRALASCGGFEFSADTPKPVAAALLREGLWQDLGLPSPGSASDEQLPQINELQRPSDIVAAPKNKSEAYAWISYFWLLRRREKLQELQVVEGDVVETGGGDVAEICSIGGNGRLYFKGGRGFGAWPDTVSVVVRADDSSKRAEQARREAANTAARRANRSEWSDAKSQDLSEFLTADHVIAEEIAELEQVIEKAEDERPIQKFLERRAHLLTAVLDGRERYCIPQKRLGAEYVPDFVIGYVNSLGVRWVLVELETPRSGIYLKGGRKLDAKTRNGVDQIVDWRSWLGENISYARKRRAEHGLGLFDIREECKGIVLVGRGSSMPQTNDVRRRECCEDRNIEIHSYDWLLELLESVLHHSGPPAVNPYLVQGDAE